MSTEKLDYNRHQLKWEKEVWVGLGFLAALGVAYCIYNGIEVTGMAHPAFNGIMHASSFGVGVEAPEGLIETAINSLGIKPGLGIDELMVHASNARSFDALSGANPNNPISMYVRDLIGGVIVGN